jgi:hypothetical protein
MRARAGALAIVDALCSLDDLGDHAILERTELPLEIVGNALVDLPEGLPELGVIVILD